jgi:hypothetical protein
MPIPKLNDFAAPSKAEAADFIRRAPAAWHKAGEPVPPVARALPVYARLATKRHSAAEGAAPYLLYFVVVHAGVHTLAVYRVQRVQDYFMLRRMVRAPKDLVRLRG